MEKQLTALDHLGRVVRESQDDALARDDELAAVRERVLSAPARARFPARWQLAAAALVIVGAIIAAGLWLRSGEDLSAQSSEGLELETGQWLEAPPDREETVRFSDGSTLLLRGSGRARIDHLGDRRVELTLDRGLAAVSVVPRQGNAYRVQAGPFGVTVTGTRFDVGWDPDREAFHLTMHDGIVLLDGPGIDGILSVVAGQTIDRVLRPATSASANQTAAPPEHPRQDPASPSAEPSVSLSPGAAPLSWRGLAAAGRYEEALAEASTRFARLCASLGAGDVLYLGDVALYAGSSSRAIEAYEAVRRRFAGSTHAATAAFQIGRLGGGTRWFRTYLAEAPSGALAREALGRILEAEQRSGGSAQARATAQQYLDRYPSGPHARLARQILAE